MQCHIHKATPIIIILRQFNQILRIVTSFFEIHFNIVLPSTLGLPKGLLPVGLLVNMLKALLPSLIQIPCSACFNLLDLITLTKLGERHKLWSSSLCRLLHSLFASILGPNIRLRILFSNSPLNVRYYVSQPYNTTDNIIVFQIIREESRRQRRLNYII